MASERAQRLAARRRVKEALRVLRPLVRVLAEIERLEGADQVGVVRIVAGEPEAHYGADLLDMVGQAVGEAGQNRVVEVYVTTTTDPIAPSRRRGKEGSDASRSNGARLQRRRSRQGA